MHGRILRTKIGTVSVEVFAFHVHSAFERYPGTANDVSFEDFRAVLQCNQINFQNSIVLMLCSLTML